MSIDPNCYYSPGPPAGGMYRGHHQSTTVMYKGGGGSGTCGGTSTTAGSLPGSMYDPTAVYNSQQMYNYNNCYEETPGISVISQNMQNVNKVAMSNDSTLSPQAKNNVDNLLLLSQQILMVNNRDTTDQQQQRPDFSCNIENRFSSSNLIKSNVQHPQQQQQPPQQQSYPQQSSYLSSDLTCQQSYLANNICQEQQHGSAYLVTASQQQPVQQQQQQSYNNFAAATATTKQVSNQLYLDNNFQQPGTCDALNRQQAFSYTASQQQLNVVDQQQLQPQQQQLNLNNAGVSLAPRAGLETLYRETDQLIRNRSNSMTDMLYQTPSSLHNELTSKRSLEVLLGQELGCMKLDENPVSDGQMYSTRRGSGTFQRPGGAAGHPHFGDSGGFRPRRRFTSLDTTAFACGSSSPLSISQQLSDDQRSQGESPLASMFLHGSSPVMMPGLDSVWTPLEQPPKSASPILDLPVLPSGTVADFVPIEEFEFESDDDDDVGSSSNGSTSNESTQTKISATAPCRNTIPPGGQTKKFESLLPENNIKSSQPDRKSKARAAKAVSAPAAGAAKTAVTGSSKSGSAAAARTLTTQTSWSQIVRTKPALTQTQSNPTIQSKSSSTSPRDSPSPTTTSATATSSTTTTTSSTHPTVTKSASGGGSGVEFHRGPKVDPRWPVEQQLFLGPIPVAVTWDDIRNTFYEKVDRHQILHTYLQSKPINDVVYGQIVFDKASLANKVLKDGPIKVSGRLISITAMKDKIKAAERKR